jgi:DEAD/DEAH box helicase domain-containing protein
MLALANVLSHVAPLFLMTDPGDIGTALDSGNFGRSALFVFDKYHGGIGFAQKLSTLWEEVLNAATDLIHDCECSTGCPSCIGSPLVGTGVGVWSDWKEVIPDKEGSLVLLHAMLGREPYVPRFPIPTKEVVTEPERDVATDDAPMPKGVDLPPIVEERIRRQVARQSDRSPRSR